MKSFIYTLLATAFFLNIHQSAKADVTISSATVAAANVNQGTANQIVYAAQMSVTTTAVTVSSIQFTLTGTHDANDLDIVRIYFNATNPTISGASNLSNVVATFAAPHTYNISISRAMPAGSSGYFIIAVDVNNTATDNNTFTINGATNPVAFGFATAPIVTNTQTNTAGVQTIDAADITTTTATVAAATVNQGTTNQIVYVAQMSVATQPVTVSSIQFTLTGTHDATDLDIVRIYFNPTNPTIAGASNLSNVVGTFAAPHTYNIGISKAMAVGSSGYFIIAVDVNNTATDNNTVILNGATNPVSFGFSTAPNVTNTQTNTAGTQTIDAADIITATATVAAATVNQGTTNQIVYIAQMSVATQPVTVSSIQFTLSGTHDATDLDIVRIYFNATNPTIAGASNLSNVVGTFAAPHTYNIGISRAMAVGSSGYFIIAVDVNNTATDNNTVILNGATNPVTFGFSTAPNVTNTQTNIAGVQTIDAGDISTSSATVAAATVNQGTTNQIVYVAQMSVATQPVTVSSIQFTLTGTHDATDLDIVRIYFNATNPTIAGASNLSNVVGTFAAPHTYNIGISRAMAAGSSGYFIIAVDVNNTATDNNTIILNGATNPVAFGFTTAPNVTNTQTNIAGVQTIDGADITTTTTATVAAANVNQSTTNQIVYVAQMSVATQPVTVSSIQFTLTGTHDATDLDIVRIYFNATNPTIAGASNLSNVVGTFAAPHTYNIGISRAMAVGSSGYFIIAVDVNNTATDNNTIILNGATNPVTFGFSTAPNVTNTQTNIAGVQTIDAADITVSTAPVAAGIFTPGTINRIVNVTTMSVATQPVTVSSIQFILTGTHNATDLSIVRIYFNATNPTIAGASNLSNVVGTFAAPHTYNIGISRAMAVGSSGYFIIAVDASNTATIGNTVKINAAVNPVTFGFTTAPNIVNNQTDNSGVQTLPVQFISAKAYEQSGGVAVEWKIATEINIEKYIIERSGDGRSFSTLGETAARGGNTFTTTYHWQDLAPLAGNNFYRVAAIGRDGKIIYSSILKISLGKTGAEISIYPNPVVKAGLLSLQLQNSEKDTYTVLLYNTNGQAVMKQTFQHNGGSAVQNYRLPSLAAGMYRIKVMSSTIKMEKTLVIQ